MFEKDKVTNPAGRPLGAKNKTAENIRTLITNFITHNLKTIQADYELLKPNERLVFIEKILKYSIPALQSVDMIQYVKKEVEALDDASLNELAEKLLQTAN